ncbi:MAG: SDR family NAD(P)-dependent oxidoreductase [Aestuariivirga sp.]
MNISGVGAIVTGGGSGLGAATARHLARLGAKVAVLDRDEEKARGLADELDARAFAVDVGDQASVKTAVEQAVAYFGSPPRILVNCAGIGLSARIVGRDGALALDVLERTMRVNFFGTYFMMSHCAKAMFELTTLGDDGERGVIINTASVAVEDGQLGQAAYAASKGAIAALCLPAAREFARSGIRVMTIAPGLFQTAMTETLSEEVKQKIAASIPFPSRLGHAEEYAKTVEHIIQNAYLNGTTIRLDGAVRLPPR